MERKYNVTLMHGRYWIDQEAEAVHIDGITEKDLKNILSMIGQQGEVIDITIQLDCPQ